MGFEECPSGICDTPGIGNIQGEKENTTKCGAYCNRWFYCEGLLKQLLKSHGGTATTPCGKVLSLEVKDPEKENTE